MAATQAGMVRRAIGEKRCSWPVWSGMSPAPGDQARRQAPSSGTNGAFDHKYLVSVW